MSPGDQDAGGGGGVVRPALDALPHPGGGQLGDRPPLHRRLGAALLPRVRLLQQRHQPRHLQPHVPEVPPGLPEALRLRGRRRRGQGGQPGARVLQRHQGLATR